MIIVTERHKTWNLNFYQMPEEHIRFEAKPLCCIWFKSTSRSTQGLEHLNKEIVAVNYSMELAI